MEEILELLETNKIVKDYDIITFIEGENFFYIIAEALIKNGSFLHIRIYISENDYKYSFHWQNDREGLILRWDNAPHYKNLKTFPHHAHRMGKS